MSSMDDPTISDDSLSTHGNKLTESKKTELRKATQNARLTSASSPSYSVMTINMNGKGTVDDRRMKITKIIRRVFASVIFCQELPGNFKEKVVDVCGTDVYDFVANGSEAAVMWRKEVFDGEPVYTTATSSSRIREMLDKRSDIDTTEVLTRTAMVKLQSRDEAYPKHPSFLAVSWHGPHNNLQLEGKRKAFNGLTCFLQEVCKEKNVSCVIIGGDFNLNTLEDEDLKSLNVSFPGYELNSRSKEKQEDKDSRRRGRRYIPYKDNFAFFTISGSNNRGIFENIRVSNVRPFEFVDAKDPGSDLLKEDQQDEKADGRERKDLLDHDPIIGVLELDLFNQIEEMQEHKGQDEIKPLSGSFKKLSISSNPADNEAKFHPLHGNVYSWVSNICQSNIDSRKSSNACSIISMAVAHQFLTTDVQPPSKEDLSNDWKVFLFSCMRKGNDLFDKKDSTTHPHQFLTAEEAAELYLDSSSSNRFMKGLNTVGPVRLVDDHFESTLEHNLKSLTQTASRCAALFIYDNKTISFLVSPDGSIIVIDSHSHPNHAPYGAAIMFAESFNSDFVSSLQEIANMNDSTPGSFSHVVLNDVN